MDATPVAIFGQPVGSREADEADSIQAQRPVPTGRRFLAYTVFSLEDVEGAPPFDATSHFTDGWPASKIVQTIARRSGARVIDYGNRAEYAPDQDLIRMPERRMFHPRLDLTASDSYDATLLHELGHWTGHKSRLHRVFGERLGDKKYAREELRAEIAPMLMAAEFRVAHDPSNHASYLSHWVSMLNKHERETWSAVKDAGTIVNYLRDFAPRTHVPGDASIVG